MNEDIMNENRIVDSFAIAKTIIKLLVEKPDVYINKYTGIEFGWGDREWLVAWHYLDLIAKEWNKFLKDAYGTIKSQGGEDLKDEFEHLVAMFKKKYGVPPVRYSGKRIVDNGVYYPASYTVLNYNEFRNRLNILGRKGLKDLDTKLHNISDVGMEVMFAKEEKERIEGINRMLLGDLNSEFSAKLLR